METIVDEFLTNIDKKDLVEMYNSQDFTNLTQWLSIEHSDLTEEDVSEITCLVDERIQYILTEEEEEEKEKLYDSLLSCIREHESLSQADIVSVLIHIAADMI